MVSHNQHPGVMTASRYEKRGDKYVCIETWECPMSVQQFAEWEQCLVNEKTAAQAYDPKITINSADAELAEIAKVKI